jgi:predicted ATP-dependent endonuclease of OLD family
MRLEKLRIITRFKNLEDFEIDFSNKAGITVLIGNNGSGKSNILEAISSIFAGLYDSKYNPNFNYELSYTKDTYKVEVKFENSTYKTKVNGVNSALKPEHLPSQLISSYSGEESRLWETYYKPFYDEYTKALKGAAIPDSELIYINKYYWNIALLTLHFYDFEAFEDIRKFCQDTLGIQTVNYLQFDFDIPTLETWLKNPNPVTNLVMTLNPNKDASVQMTLEEFKLKLDFINEIDLFKYLAAAFMPKDDKVITKIEIDYNTGLKAESLSEGEKKLLLIMLILEVIGDENSLILLDEPDSHIHLSNKEQIEKLLKAYSNRENIITTHSPTLTHNFDLKHITMLSKKANNDAQVEAMEKQKIVYELTKGIWSYQEQNIFLSSRNDILLVEGKTDEVFLKKALKVLKKTEPSYTNLDFEYLPSGGADGVKLLTKKFKPKEGQKIIALFDRDGAGWSAINGIFGEKNKWNSNNFGTYRVEGEVFVMPYPRRPYFKGTNFNVEDYFPKYILKHYALKGFKGLDSLVSKKDFKTSIEKDCNTFKDEDFKHFKKAFDLIMEIKTK